MLQVIRIRLFPKFKCYLLLCFQTPTFVLTSAHNRLWIFQTCKLQAYSSVTWTTEYMWKGVSKKYILSSAIR